LNAAVQSRTSRRAGQAPGGGSAFYRDDLATIHDQGFGALAEHAAHLLVGELRRRDVTNGLVLDLGCGSGILAERVVAAGYAVLGVDLSAPLITLARRRVPSAEFVVASLLDVELPPCVAVTAVGECLNYLFDPGNTARARRGLLRRIRRALLPGGVLLFDAAGPGRVPGAGGRASLRTHATGDGWAVLMIAEEDRRRRLLQRHITSFRRVEGDAAGGLWRREEEVHRLRLLPPAEVLAELRRAGFRTRPLRGYRSLRFPPGLTGYLATG
jgi:SAM-dependent methyltransferase